MKAINNLEPYTVEGQMLFTSDAEEIVNLFQEGPKVDFKTEEILKNCTFLVQDGNKLRLKFFISLYLETNLICYLIVDSTQNMYLY